MNTFQETYQTLGVPVPLPLPLHLFFPVPLPPNAGHGLLIHEVSRSHTTTQQVGRTPLDE